MNVGLASPAFKTVCPKVFAGFSWFPKSLVTASGFVSHGGGLPAGRGLHPTSVSLGQTKDGGFKA